MMGMTQRRIAPGFETPFFSVATSGETILLFLLVNYKSQYHLRQRVGSSIKPHWMIDPALTRAVLTSLRESCYYDHQRKTMNLFDEFQWRGMVHDATPELRAVLAAEKLIAYIGFDPSAASLHVGSLLPIMGLARLQRFGHTPIAIAGGGTGLIGDPSGKTKERQLLTYEQAEENLAGIKEQLSRFLDFDAKTNPARIINNLDWLGPISMMEFLRDVGKYFTVNNLLAKEAIKRRLETDDGISFTEFSYPLLRAYDYLVLFDTYGCTLQMGGSDQWGNIVAGIDLIRRLRGARAHGLVFPLVATASGVKFGKTEAGAVWLDPE